MVQLFASYLVREERMSALNQIPLKEFPITFDPFRMSGKSVVDVDAGPSPGDRGGLNEAADAALTRVPRQMWL
jgi:hypothetical protein